MWGCVADCYSSLCFQCVTLIKDDHDGSKQFAYSCISTAVVVNGLKYATDDTPIGRRPNGGRHSFPSGHTSSVFQGAFFYKKGMDGSTEFQQWH